MWNYWMSIVSSSTAHASHETKHHHHDSHDQDIFLLAIFRVRPWTQAFNPHDPLVREVHRGKMGVSTQMTLQKPQNMMHSVRNTGLFWGIPQFWKTHTHTHTHISKRLQESFWKKLMSHLFSLLCVFFAQRLPEHLRSLFELKQLSSEQGPKATKKQPFSAPWGSPLAMLHNQ